MALELPLGRQGKADKGRKRQKVAEKDGKRQVYKGNPEQTEAKPEKKASTRGEEYKKENK